MLDMRFKTRLNSHPSKGKTRYKTTCRSLIESGRNRKVIIELASAMTATITPAPFVRRPSLDKPCGGQAGGVGPLYRGWGLLRSIVHPAEILRE